VSIADPSQPDLPLVAVSPAFEQMTGYSCEEIVGKNCRFLNHDCHMPKEQKFELRRCCQTGKRFSGLLQNRHRSGATFLNLLDVRGLTVAKDAETGEDIWYLVGIQSDVTDLVAEDGCTPPEISLAHERELQGVAEHLRQELQKEFAQVALALQILPVHSTADAQCNRCVFADDLVVPAAPGVECGPKPPTKPTIVLLPEAAWVKADSEDESSEPEQVHTVARGIRNNSRCRPCAASAEVTTLSSMIFRLRSTLMAQFIDRPCPQMMSAFMLGLGSMMLYRVFFVQHERIQRRT